MTTEQTEQRPSKKEIKESLEKIDERLYEIRKN